MISRTLKFSPGREQLFNELHTRPFPVLQSPASLSHFAINSTDDLADEARNHLKSLCAQYSVVPPDPGSSCFYQDFGGFSLRWEQHTEFCTYLIIRSSDATSPFSETALDLLPNSWLCALPGEIVSAQHVEIRDTEVLTTDKETLRLNFEGQRLIGSAVVRNKAEVWTAYKIHSDGFGRFLVLNRHLNACQIGRLVRALLELETYRMFMLRALPLAKSVVPQVMEMDATLARIIQQITDIESMEDERRLLSELSVLSARNEQLISDTNYRFSATEAYFALIQARIDELSETEISGLMTIGGFLKRRLTPAWRTCEATRDNLDDLSIRINRANALIRSRVELTLESQNQELLASMNRRSKLQLRLQQAVEGLSVAAISYYATGLVKYVSEAMEVAGAPIHSHLVTGLSVPFIVGAVAWTLHRFKRKIHD